MTSRPIQMCHPRLPSSSPGRSPGRRRTGMRLILVNQYHQLLHHSLAPPPTAPSSRAASATQPLEAASQAGPMPFPAPLGSRCQLPAQLQAPMGTHSMPAIPLQTPPPVSMAQATPGQTGALLMTLCPIFPLLNSWEHQARVHHPRQGLCRWPGQAVAGPLQRQAT